MAVYEERFATTGGVSRAGHYINYAGAALSLALIAGLSLWGYKLIMRDVSGIPVVRAMEGEMRVLPDNPGGAVALHTGLAVNEVAAIGEAGAPEDRLILAPATEGLAQEDLVAQPAAEAGEVMPAESATALPAAMNGAEVATAEAAPLNADEILALADQIAAGLTPIEAIPEQVQIVAASVPGVAQSIRPATRPASLQVTAPAAAEAAAPVAAEVAAAPIAQEVAVTTETFAAGTDLVQLGAFPSPTLAATEWSRLLGLFGPLMAGREQVIQVSNQSSGTWYRLRASGFEDRADAKRFCAALEAEGANCIPVVVN